MTDPKGPVVIELSDDAPDVTPATAPPVPDLPTGAPQGRAMQTLATLGARRPSRLTAFFMSALVGLVGLVVSVALWDFVTQLLTRNPVLATLAGVLIGVVVLCGLIFAMRELSALARLRRTDKLRQQADAALAHGDLAAARTVVRQVERLYSARGDAAWGLERLGERQNEMLDADALLGLAEREVLAPLDDAARREVEAAARQVATVTAIVPIALADLVAALVANLRMIRRVAEIYGGRGGMLGNWRLARGVMTHLVATGAVAVGDDMLEPIIGGGVLGKLSRRFGEGLVNGALTARVGVAAMDVCRPLPFHQVRRPSTSKLVQRALKGLFSKC